MLLFAADYTFRRCLRYGFVPPLLLWNERSPGTQASWLVGKQSLRSHSYRFCLTLRHFTLLSVRNGRWLHTHTVECGFFVFVCRFAIAEQRRARERFFGSNRLAVISFFFVGRLTGCVLFYSCTARVFHCDRSVFR